MCAQRVVGLDPLESALTLHGLRDFATGEAFTYSHEWTVGDCVMWDNTGTLHRAEQYDPATGRLAVPQAGDTEFLRVNADRKVTLTETQAADGKLSTKLK